MKNPQIDHEYGEEASEEEIGSSFHKQIDKTGTVPHCTIHDIDPSTNKHVKTVVELNLGRCNLDFVLLLE